MRNTVTYLFIIFMVGIFTSCHDDDAGGGDLQEMSVDVTQFVFRLTNPGPNGDVVCTFQKSGQDESEAPLKLCGNLARNAQYAGIVGIWDKTTEPSIYWNREILEEPSKYQLFYESSIEDLTISYDQIDVDLDGNPIGLMPFIRTGQAGSGTLKITWRKNPNKLAEGVQDGRIDEAGGETVFEVTFELNVE